MTGAFRRDLEVWLDETLGLEGQKKIFVALAREELDRFEEAWRQATGPDAEFQRFVDGVEGAPLESVRMPRGIILEKAAEIGQATKRVVELVRRYTKTVTGGYRAEHETWVNDVAGAFRDPNPSASDTVDIVNVSDFAAKGEVRGFTDLDAAGFPVGWGLMRGVASRVKKEFRGSNVSIRVHWDRYGADRVPAIRIE